MIMCARKAFSIQAFKEGDQQAFNFIFAAYYSSLCFFANRLIQLRPVAEDIIQEAFVKLWKLRKAFNCQQSIKAFLFIITRNACLNFIKQWERDKEKEEHWSMTVEVIEDDKLDQLTRSESLVEVYEAVKGLPPECRKVITLYFVDGFRNPEIAKQLELSVHTVKNQKARGLYLLKKRLLIR